MPFGRLFRGILHATVAGFILAVVGCQPAVREDRTITLGPNGHAAFQHGHNGVFVTDPKTGKPNRIYELTASDLASSPPVWNPTGTRVVFTVARALDGTGTAPTSDSPADGRWYAGVPIQYTCWQYDLATGTSEKLFAATANHTGYVGAGLAVAWHPDGRGLDYVDRSDAKRHRVYSFDLTTRQAKPVPLPAAEHIALGTSPNRPHRCALLGAGGLWVESNGGWWCVPNSEPDIAQLETLRLQLPRWSRDGTKLAFVGGSDVRVCDTATRKTETWFRAALPQPENLVRARHLSSGLQWHPDGTRVGMIDGTRLGLVGPGGEFEIVSAPDEHVVAFTGWDAGGRRMAYVTADKLPYADGAVWATLFVPNMNARTSLRVADANGANPKTVMSGLRATFPNWSPAESKLSVWLTVEPPYRLADGRFGMRPGDPAALIDPDTGKLDWLAVNGTEHAQIGHVELRTGRLDEALRRFDEAASALPKDAKADWMVFRAIAFQKAGRDADARAAWQQFAPPEPTPRNAAQDSLMRAIEPRWPLVQAGMVRPRHRFVAEAFVSLELAPEGIEFFRREVREAASTEEKLSAAVALDQLLLLTDQKAEYAECVVEYLLPLASQVLATATENRPGAEAVAWTLLPLAFEEFATALPEQVVRRIAARISEASSNAGDVDCVCQLVLRQCGQRLKDATMIDRATTRLTVHPARERWNTDHEMGHELLWRIRIAFLADEFFRDQFGTIFGAVPNR